MKRNNIIPPVVAVLGGVVGCALRKWDLSAGFEADTGLAIPGASSAIVLILWSFLVAAGILASVWKCGGEKADSSVLRGGEGNTAYITAVLISGAFLLVSAGLEVLNYSVNSQLLVNLDSALARVAAMLLQPLRLLLSVGGLFAAGLWGRSVYRGREDRVESLPLMELCLLFCVWLLSDYQTRAADPVILDYVYAVFAICFALMGLYYLLGISFGEGRPRRGLFFGLLGVYFCLVTLADSHTLSDVFRYGFAVIFLTTHAILLLNPGSTEETKTESDIDG